MRYYQNIDAVTAWRLIYGGYSAGRRRSAPCRILDVRDPAEYAAGHLPGAINIPMYQVGRKVPNQMPGRQQPLLVYCGSGARSLPAVQVLAVIGYQNLYNLYKGLEDWPYPLVKEENGKVKRV